MCVIIHKPIGIEIPNVEALEKCFNTNDDGCGFAFSAKNKVFLRKGFMEFWDLIDTLFEMDDQFNLKNHQLIIHFRLGTSAGIEPKYTHPFPVSNKKKDLFRLRGTYNIICAHNGILPGFGDSFKSNKKVKLSDTQDFIWKILRHLIHRMDDKRIYKVIDNLLDGDKLIILWSNGKAMRFGKWHKENGCFFSNLNWKRAKNYHFPQYVISDYIDFDVHTLCQYCGKLDMCTEIDKNFICRECLEVLYGGIK